MKNEPPDAGEILIFGNPIAGRGKGRQIAKRLAARLARDGFAVRMMLVKPDELELGDVVRPDVRAAIAIGGDGTLRGVAERVSRDYRDAKQPVPPLLVIPLGTANLMGRHLGIKWNDAALDVEVSRAIRAGKTVELDAARCNDSLFLLMAGVGFDAHVVHELSRVRKGPIRMASYLLPTALSVQAYSYPPLDVWVDGKKVFDATPGFAMAGNVAEYGTGFPILSHARSDDGLLDVCCLPCRSQVELVELFLKVMAGEHVGAEGVVYVHGQHVRIEAIEPVPVQLDGDEAGHTPIEIDLLPFRLPFIVP